METTRLTPKPKTLIYCKIKECEQEIRMIRKGIDTIPEDDTYGKKEFVEMWELEIEFLEKQIEHWQELLFNN